ncbi:cytochrome P450 [Mycobacterium seoulense]|uniref:cytochrome P450 n=1 Tax=Mycobacterium seoulense TaxID=386911 RepID=UPI0013D4BDA3|nr:cytochrome P450 [Mycobacterium seoulense]MCV7436624.1 cytochrome P450 [Mycobacterium seoulense]
MCVVIGSGGEAAFAALEVMRSDDDAAAGYREWLAAAQRAGQRVLRQPNGTYVLWRRDDVLAALRDGDVFASRQGELMPGQPPFAPYRKIMVDLLFTPGNSREMLKPVRGFIEERVGALATKLDACDGAAVADAVWRAGFVTVSGLPADVDLQALDPKLVGAIRRAPQGGPDVISRLATEPLTDEEVLGMIGSVLRGLIFASFPIKAGLAMLARQPTLQRELRGSPDRQRKFIEELLRLDGGAKTVSRITSRSVTIGETTIPAGSPVELCVGLVHRDEADEMSGHSIKLDGPQRHWSFGGGPHRCPASHLVRDLLGAFFEVWLAEVPFFWFDWNGGEVPKAWYPKPYSPAPAEIFDGWFPVHVPLRWRPAR